MPYTINGQTIDDGSVAEPQNINGTMWVPLRSIAEALGGSADWDPDNRVAIAYLDGNIATLKIGDATADVNGEQSQLQEAPKLQDGETWIPVRFFNLLGYNLSVDPQNNSVDISSAA